MSVRRARRGFILVPVVLALTLLAAVAVLLNRDSGMNVNMAASALQAATARYVAEAGISQLSYRAQNSNCVNYPALSNVTFGAGQFSASASPTAGSPVTLTATATTASGATATLTRANVPVYWTTPYTRTLQPAVLLQDTYIDSYNATKNYGASTTLKLTRDKTAPLLRFDLATIPPASIVQSAQLMLFKLTGSGGYLSVYPLTRSWVEGTLDGGILFANGATWNTTNGLLPWTTPGGDYDGTVSATSPGDGTAIWLAWDVTNIVRNWVSGASVNNGVILAASAGGDTTFVAGDDTTQRANTPKLIITLLPRCDWTAPPSGVTLQATADAYIDGNNQLLNYGISSSLPMAEQPMQRVVVRFDTSAVTPGTLLTSARLRYYVSAISNRSGSTMNLQAHAVTTSWAEGTTNGGLLGGVSWINTILILPWSNAGGDYTSGTAATLALPSTFNNGWIEFDITALAQAWVDGVQPNYGVILREMTADVLTLASREGASNQPQLVIQY